MSAGEPRELVAFVPTNRRDKNRAPTHMDGWNEIIAAYRSNRHKGSERELENVAYVATHVRKAMRAQGWERMRDKGRAARCSVHICFIERNRRRDIGNVHGGAKYALDALTQRHTYGVGAIYDDSQRWLSDVTYQVESDKEHPGMIIYIRKD